MLACREIPVQDADICQGWADVLSSAWVLCLVVYGFLSSKLIKSPLKTVFALGFNGLSIKPYKVNSIKFQLILSILSSF